MTALTAPLDGSTGAVVAAHGLLPAPRPAPL